MNVLNDPSFIHKVTKLQDELDRYAEMEGGIIEIMDDDLEMMALEEAREAKEAKEAREAREVKETVSKQ